REQDEERGAIVGPREGLQDRGEAEEEPRGRDEVRQQVEAARAAAALAPATAPAQAPPRLEARRLGPRLHHAPPGRRATTVSPPPTRGPRATQSAASSGSRTSVRDPKRISP